MIQHIFLDLQNGQSSQFCCTHHALRTWFIAVLCMQFILLCQDLCLDWELGSVWFPRSRGSWQSNALSENGSDWSLLADCAVESFISINCVCNPISEGTYLTAWVHCCLPGEPVWLCLWKEQWTVACSWGFAKQFMAVPVHYHLLRMIVFPLPKCESKARGEAHQSYKMTGRSVRWATTQGLRLICNNLKGTHYFSMQV